MDIFAQPEIIEAMATIAAAFVLLAITLVAAHVGVERLRRIWLIGRGKVEAVIEYVDEADDPALVRIDSWLDKLVPSDWNKHAALFLPVFLRAAADGLDAALGVPQEPEQGEPSEAPKN